MTNVKDLMNNEELMQHMVEDLDDFDECASVTYEVWAIGYNEAGVINGTDMLMGEFDNPDEAVKCATNITLADIIYQAAEEDNGKGPTTQTSYITIEVETVVTDDDEGTMNVGTIYRRDVYLDEVDEEEDDEIVNLCTNDYIPLDDGNIEVSRNLLNNFNKNDRVQFMFVDEEHMPIITYRIISKTTANTFICEFIY